MGNAKALEVLGALATYRGDGRCPACDGKVVEGVLSDGNSRHRGIWSSQSQMQLICTVCNWSQPRPPIIDYGDSVSFTVNEILGASDRR